ncbi:hypothetical protein [Pandoraea terrae]|uniref:hypothetical protein n=1 Tax=Pandoraea terrae TaxID=1537710 RepID=UPI001242887A|nr:hypothetical protein [Pandoraea terrae]
MLERMPWFAPVDLAARTVFSLNQWISVDNAEREAANKGRVSVWNPSVVEDRPLVLWVPNLLAQAWNRRMPPGAFAAELINALAAKRPKLIAISFDALDPLNDDPMLSDPACDGLRDNIRRRAAAEPGVSFLMPLEASRGACMPPEVTTKDVVDRIVNSQAGYGKFIRALDDASLQTRVVVKASLLPNVSEFGQQEAGDPITFRIMSREIAFVKRLCDNPSLYVAWSQPQLWGGFFYDRHVATLGNLASYAARQPHAPNGFRYVSDDSSVDDLCVPFSGAPQSRQARAVLPPGPGIEPLDVTDSRRILEGIEDRRKQSGFNVIGTVTPRYLEIHSNLWEINEKWLKPGAPIGDMIPSDGLAGRVVFIGDDTRRDDLMGLKNQPEVALSAAVYYGNLHNATTLKHAFAFAGDVILGAALGWLFAWSWGGYWRARARMLASPVASVGGMVRQFPSWAYSRFLIVRNLALLAGLTYALFEAANWMVYWNDIWVNPLPLIVGMFVKGLLASREVGDTHPYDWWTYYNRHPDTPYQVLIVAACLAVLFATA